MPQPSVCGTPAPLFRTHVDPHGHLGRGMCIRITAPAWPKMAPGDKGVGSRPNGPDRVDVSLPTFKSTRDGTQKAAIVLPPELFDAIGMAVAQAFSALEKPTPTPEPVRDLLGASSLGSAKNSDYASRGR